MRYAIKIGLPVNLALCDSLRDARQIPIDEIKVCGGREQLNIDHAQELSERIRELGFFNPVSIDKDFFLIAGLYQLVAVKLLDWSEVECIMCSLEGL